MATQFELFGNLDIHLALDKQPFFQFLALEQPRLIRLQNNHLASITCPFPVKRVVPDMRNNLTFNAGGGNLCLPTEYSSMLRGISGPEATGYYSYQERNFRFEIGRLISEVVVMKPD